MPLKNGYGRKTIRANIASLAAEGLLPRQARAVALTQARASYFAAHPNGMLPLGLAWPKTARTRADYNKGHAREFGPPPIPLRTEDDFQDNPRPDARGIAQARRLYEGFTGQAAQGVKLLKVPAFKSGVAIGKVLGIIYSVDATGEKFRHSFKVSSRPYLVVSSDGNQVIICGGKFTFTNRGFTDH